MVIPLPSSGYQARSSQPALSRRLLLALGSGAGLSVLLSSCGGAESGGAVPQELTSLLNRYESDSDLRIGLCAIVNGEARLSHRAEEVFPMCSTFKPIAVGAMLAQHAEDTDYLRQAIRIAQNAVVDYSPITEKHAGATMTLAEICEAALRYSDNTAGNLILEQIGGPAGVTAFANSLGYRNTRLDRWETELNEALPGDPRDTSTPADLCGIFDALLVGDGLAPAARDVLRTWMRGNTTSAKRFGAALPAGARLADKTGSGSYGTAHDVGAVFRADAPPVILAVLTRTQRQDAQSNDAAIAQTARVALAALS
ncbi:class A beta-lactamase [Acaricomes phytoseiuli]|nr:class A beta-lactamase [Acaricomes phytoseiuli]